MAEMIMDGIIALNKAKKYTADSLDGLGAVKGANCTIKSTTPKDNGTEIIFEWTGISGTKETTTMNNETRQHLKNLLNTRDFFQKLRIKASNYIEIRKDGSKNNS